MKKALLLATIAISALFCSINAQEFKNVKEVINGHGNCELVEGKVAVLKEKVSAKLVLDYSHAHIVQFEKERGVVAKDLGTVEEFYAAKTPEEQKQWEEIKKNVYNLSVEKFNKSFKMKIKEADAKYEIKLVFDNIDLGNTAASAVGFRFHEEGGAEFSGNLIVTEIATGNVVLNLHIINVKGANPSAYHYTVNKRMMCTIGDIFFGKYLPKVLDKNS